MTTIDHPTPPNGGTTSGRSIPSQPAPTAGSGPASGRPTSNPAKAASPSQPSRFGHAVLVGGLVLAASSIAAISIVAAHGSGGGSKDLTGQAAGIEAGRAALTAPVTGAHPSTLLRPGSSVRPSVAPPAGGPGPTQPGARAVASGAPAPHGAVYRQGKLYLVGALPNRAVADAFVKKAAEVIGAANVVDQYVIDRRAKRPTDGRVRVDEPFLFRTGSAQIDPGYEPLLTLGVRVMQLNPQVKMQVIGFTDDVGPLATNLALSRARAQAVADWITQRGIAADRFVLTGKGPADPLVSNASAQGRTRNRRIEVELLGLLQA